MADLREYKRKRDFSSTPEPAGKPERSPENEGLFLVQKHRATRLHYDVRLELDGVLKSWAVPKGPSLDPADKRLAVMTEDHPLDYADFEGVIPEGNYGAGEVIIWDRGRWRWSPSSKGKRPKSALAALEAGKLSFTVESEKLAGRFVLARGGGGDWMMIKVRDEEARPGSDVAAERPESVVTSRTIEDLKAGAAGEERWLSDKGRDVPEAREAPDLDALLEGLDAPSGAVPRKLQPMLATLVESPPPGETWLHEMKLDGIRAFAFVSSDGVELVSRQGNALEGAFPEVARALERLPLECVLDGEICVLDAAGRARFGLIQPRIHVGNARTAERLARESPATFFGFDVVHVGGRDLRRVPLEARKKVLRAILPEGDPRVRYVDHIEAAATTSSASSASTASRGPSRSRRPRSTSRGGRGSGRR